MRYLLEEEVGSWMFYRDLEDEVGAKCSTET